MNTSIIITAGIAMFFNFAIIIYKGKLGRYLDMVLDLATFIAIVYITGSSGATGLVAGMIASALLSIFLLTTNPFEGFSVDSYSSEITKPTEL